MTRTFWFTLIGIAIALAGSDVAVWAGKLLDGGPQ